MREIKMHKSYSRVATLTGLGLIALGVLVSFSFSDLGLLIVLIGILRTVSGVYDLGRKDDLERSLERIDEKTGLGLEKSAD